MKKTMGITPEGTRDLLFEECAVRRDTERRLTGLFEQHGFSEVMTPGIEFFDVFQAERGTMPSESMYKLTDNKGRLLVLRPDSTTPIARMTATRLKSAPLPLRLYYAQDVYHLNHGLSGHNDQVFQTGVELIGAAGMRADAEIIALAAESLQRCAAGDFRIELGHVGVFRALVKELAVDEETEATIHNLTEMKNYGALSDLLDTLPASEAVDAIRRLPRLFGGEEVLQRAQTLLHSESARAALAYLSRLYRTLCELGLGEQVMIDLGLLHRNEYYTGVIFRGYMEGSGETVVSGGRYDDLLSQFGDPLPATGFAVNVDAAAKARAHAGAAVQARQAQVLVFAADGCEADGLRQMAALAAAGETVAFSPFDTLARSREYAAACGMRQVYTVENGQTAVYDV